MLTDAGVLPFTGDGRFATIVLLAVVLGVQNSTVHHLGAPDLTTTVLTLTLTGLAADNPLAGGPGAKPHRRLSSVAVIASAAAVAVLIVKQCRAAEVLRGRRRRFPPGIAEDPPLRYSC